MEAIEVAPEAAPEVESAASHESAPSTEVDYATTSDDDILDRALGDDDAEKEPAAHDAATKPAAEAKPVQDLKSHPDARVEEKKEELEQEQVEDVEPETLQKLYADPAVKAELQKLFQTHPEVRKAWFRAGQIGDLFPTVAEAKAVRGLFPTLETAQHASDAAAVFARMDQTYMQDPRQFAERLASANPNAFSALVTNSRDVLYKMSPDAYRTTIGEPVAAEVLANAEEWAVANEDEPFMAAIAILRDRSNLAASGQGKTPQSRNAAPVDPRITELENLKREAGIAHAESIKSFESSVHQGFWDGLRSAVDQVVGKPSAMSDKAISKIKQETFHEVATKIASQRNLRPVYENFIRSGDMSEGTRAKAVSYLMGYARQILGPVAKSRLQEWSNDIMKVNQADVQQAKTAQKKRDVGSGSGQARNTAKSGNGKVDYSKFSDDDLLEGRHLS
jgi:hypothetical protein